MCVSLIRLYLEKNRTAPMGYCDYFTNLVNFVTNVVKYYIVGVIFTYFLYICIKKRFGDSICCFLSNLESLFSPQQDQPDNRSVVEDCREDSYEDLCEEHRMVLYKRQQTSCVYVQAPTYDDEQNRNNSVQRPQKFVAVDQIDGCTSCVTLHNCHFQNSNQSSPRSKPEKKVEVASANNDDYLNLVLIINTKNEELLHKLVTRKDETKEKEDDYEPVNRFSNVDIDGHYKPHNDNPSSETYNSADTGEGKSKVRFKATPENEIYGDIKVKSSEKGGQKDGKKGGPSSGKKGGLSSGKKGAPSSDKIGGPSSDKIGGPSSDKIGGPSSDKIGPQSAPNSATSIPHSGRTNSPTSGKGGIVKTQTAVTYVEVDQQQMNDLSAGSETDTNTSTNTNTNANGFSRQNVDNSYLEESLLPGMYGSNADGLRLLDLLRQGNPFSHVHSPGYGNLNKLVYEEYGDISDDSINSFGYVPCSTQGYMSAPRPKTSPVHKSSTGVP